MPAKDPAKIAYSTKLSKQKFRLPFNVISNKLKKSPNIKTLSTVTSNKSRLASGQHFLLPNSPFSLRFQLKNHVHAEQITAAAAIKIIIIAQCTRKYRAQNKKGEKEGRKSWWSSSAK